MGKSSIGESWAFEYKMMYDEIKDNDFKIDINQKEFMFQRLDKPNYHKLNTWNDLTKKIVKI